MSDTTQTPGVHWRDVAGFLRTPWAFILIVLAGVALLDPGNFGFTIGFAWRALLGTLPYIVAAVLLLAYLKAAGADVMVTRAFQGR